MAVIFDAKSTRITGDGVSSLSDTSLTVGTGSNRALAVLLSRSGNDVSTSVTWGGTALTLLSNVVNGFDECTEIWGLLNPASGAQTLAITWSSTQSVCAAGVSFTGVEQSSLAAAFTGANSATGSTSPATVTISSNVGDIVVACQASVFCVLTEDNTSIYHYDSLAGTGLTANRAAGAASVTLSASQSAAQTWASSGINIRAAAITSVTQLRVPYLSKLFSWVQAPAFQPYNLALYGVAVVQVPFVQTDWSRPFDIRILPPDLPALNLNLFTNPIPFGPYDYSEGALRVFPFRPDTTQPFNPNIYTNPIPFAQYMWTDPVGVGPPPPQAIPYNINVFTNFLPFGPFDWSKPFQLPPERPDPVRGLNINLFTNPIPFAQYMWTDPVGVGVPSPQAFPYNFNIFTNPIPFFNFIAQPPTVPPFFAATVPYNVPLYTVTVTVAPFAQYDWPVAKTPRPQQDVTRALNPNIFTNPIPFNQDDWSTTKFQTPRAPDASQSTGVNLLPDPTLFMLVDWSGSASSLRPRVPDQASYNQSLYTVTAQAAPFIPIDWSKPFFPRVLPLAQATLNIQLFTNPIPVFNYDVSVQVRIKGSSDTTQPYNVNLYGVVVVQVPFVQTDWSRPFVPRPYVTQDKIYNPNLFTNPIPFAQYSWPTQVNVPQAQLDRSVRTNPNLFTNPFPFSQSSYPTQRPVKLGVFPLPPYNPNLYTASVAGTTVHIVKFIGNMGHFMIR